MNEAVAARGRKVGLQDRRRGTKRGGGQLAELRIEVRNRQRRQKVADRRHGISAREQKNASETGATVGLMCTQAVYNIDHRCAHILPFIVSINSYFLAPLRCEVAQVLIHTHPPTPQKRLMEPRATVSEQIDRTTEGRASKGNRPLRCCGMRKAWAGLGVGDAKLRRSEGGPECQALDC